MQPFIIRQKNGFALLMMLFFKSLLPLLFIMMIFNDLSSQNSDFQTWTSLGLEKKFNKKITVELEQELRMVDNSRSAGTILTDVGIAYRPLKWFKASGNYRFILRRLSNGSYDDRYRFYVNAHFRHKTGFADYSLRSRFQQQFSDLSREDFGNPENYLRNKFTFKPQVNHKIMPYASAESYHNLSKDMWVDPSDIRTEIGAEYKTRHNQTLNLYFLYQQELRSKKNDSEYIFGISYLFTL